ncbi:MAG: HD domain-containing protein [Phycisphaerae bacterium]|nr:HD domain-containing protein [Phycisphaerae bacterium]
MSTNCSDSSWSGKVITDPIHGVIHLTDREVKVVDTPSFQRLRGLKQLAMAQSVYPNATHTRFAHSIGALGMMIRILDAVARNKTDFSKEQKEDLRLAALLHDVGHYPYSHLLERIDSVKLTENEVDDGSQEERVISKTRDDYPSHEKLGEVIVTSAEACSFR